MKITHLLEVICLWELPFDIYEPSPWPICADFNGGLQFL
jgi:hypothetical protein